MYNTYKIHIHKHTIIVIVSTHYTIRTGLIHQSYIKIAVIVHYSYSSPSLHLFLFIIVFTL